MENSTLEFYKTEQTYRTIRFLGAGVLLVIGLGIIAWASVQIATATNPWYVHVGNMVVSFLAGSWAGPVTYGWVGRFRGYIRTHAGRTTAIEASIDSSRTSSDINPDGTGPHDE